MSAVRLWREERPADCRPAWHNDGAPPWGEYIALPASEHAEIVALLGEARGLLSSKCADCDGWGDRESGRPCSTCKRTGVDPRSLAARLDAALAGQEGGAK